MTRAASKLRLFLRPGAPSLVMSGFATEAQIREVMKGMCLTEADTVILKGNPNVNAHKFVSVPRPSNWADWKGNSTVTGAFSPGLLHLLKLLYFDKFIASIKAGSEAPTALFLFRDTEGALLGSYEFLLQKLGDMFDRVF